MKKYVLFFVAVMGVLGTMALPVDSKRAVEVANRFWNAQGCKGMLVERPTAFAHLHLFVGDEGGFVLVSADDVARPVLAWSADAPVGDTLHAAVDEWLASYDRQIAYASIIRAKSASAWRNAEIDNDPVTTVGPLMTTTWDQGAYYNDSCPIISGNYHYYTGCVATAVAQVMKYHNHPAVGHGNHSYHVLGSTFSANFGSTTYAWNQMPNALTSASTATQKAAVAQLMYHVAVAVEMSYALGVSSATSVSYGDRNVCAENALKQYFGYSNNVRSLSRSAYSQQQWLALIKTEIDAQRPVLYSGRGSEDGHSFVCDGYDSRDRLHINWGWGGYCDGWFYSDALSPMGSGAGGNGENDYSYRQEIIIGIAPDNSTYNTAQYTISLTASAGGTVNGGGTYGCNSMRTISATASDGYRFDRWSDGVGWNPRTMPVLGNTNLTAIFVPTTGSDTLQLDNGTSLYYGFRPSSVVFDGDMMEGHQQLTAVMYLPSNASRHTVTVEYGNNQTYTKSEYPIAPGFWNTIFLDDTISLSTQHDVTITVTPETGVMWSMVGGEPIRAICDGMFRPHRLDVSSFSLQAGYVTGGGYYAGNNVPVTISAVPFDNTCSFLQWNDGNSDTPRVVQLTSDTSFMAFFHSPYTFYLNANPNDTSLGRTEADLNGWHTLNECPLSGYTAFAGEAVYCYFTKAEPNISARFDHWNCDTAGLYFNPINPEVVSVRNVVHDTVNLEAVFVPVHNGDTLRYDNGGDNGFGWGYPTLYDTSRHYRWAVKYNPAVLRGVSHIEQVVAYLPYERDANDHSVQCNYTVQVYQGGENGPQTLLGNRVVATGYQSQIAYLSNHYDGDMWRRATFYPPLAIDSTQPVWVVLSCTSSRQSYLPGISRWSAMRASFYSGNPNSNYVWTAQTGWTHYTAFYHNRFTFDPEYENHHHSWRIRSVTSNAKATVKTRPNDIGAGEYPVGSTATVTMPASNCPSGYLFDHWEWYSAEDPSIHGTSTDNPVTFTVTGDVVYISHCVPDQSLVHVNARPNNNAWGTVMGSGDYHAGDIVTLMAMPNSGYHFKWWMYPGWGEQYVDNPFILTLGQDAAGVTIDIVGYFEADEEPPVGIEEVETGGITLYPNPANSTFTVFGLRPGVVVELLAIDGRRIGAWIAEGDNLVVDVSQIPVGNYLLRTEGVVRRIAVAR